MNSAEHLDQRLAWVVIVLGVAVGVGVLSGALYGMVYTRLAMTLACIAAVLLLDLLPRRAKPQS